MATKTTAFNTLGFSAMGMLLLLFSFCCNPVDSVNERYAPRFSADTINRKVLIFGVPTQSYYESSLLLVKYLNKNLKNIQVKLVGGITLTDYFEKLDKGFFDMTVVNGIKALQSQAHGYKIVGKLADDDSYRGVILVHKDSSIGSVADLKGKIISLPGAYSLAGSMMPLYFLHEKGLNVNRDLKRLYVPSFESAFMNVYLGKTTACTAWLTSWESFRVNRPEIASRLLLKWQTGPLVNNAIILKKDLDSGCMKELTRLLFTLHQDPEGLKALQQAGIIRFEKADSSTYVAVKQFEKKYQAVIH